MISSTSTRAPAILDECSLKHIGITCASSNGDQEFRAHHEMNNEQPAIVLFARPLPNGLFQSFWNWLYIDAERELAKKAVGEVFDKSENGVAVARDFRKKFKDQKILNVSETGQIIFSHQPHLLNVALENNKTAEQRKALANSLTHAKNLSGNSGFQLWLQSNENSEKKFHYFFQFTDRLLTDQSPPASDAVWDAALLLDFAHEWKTSIAHNRHPDFHPYPTTAIVEAVEEVVDLVIAKFGPRMAKTGTHRTVISVGELKERLRGDDNALAAMKYLSQRIRNGYPIFDETSRRVINMLNAPEASPDDLENCVKNFELFLRFFHAEAYGSGQIDFELIEEFARRWTHFSEASGDLKKVVPMEVGSALDSVFNHSRHVRIAI